jgi:hypothetical protein
LARHRSIASPQRAVPLVAVKTLSSGIGDIGCSTADLVSVKIAFERYVADFGVLLRVIFSMDISPERAIFRHVNTA